MASGTGAKSGWLLGIWGALWAAPSSWGAQVPRGVKLHPTQHLTLHVGSDPDSLDAHRTETLSEAMVIEDTFAGLVALDPKGEVVGDLAHKWEQTGPTTWVFHLRPKLKWSNGTPLLPEHIIESYRRYFNPKEGFLTVSAFTAFIKNANDIVEGKLPPTDLGIAVTHKGTAITITTPTPIPFLPAVLINSQFRVVPCHTIKKWGRDWLKPENIITSGPFVVTNRLVNNKIESKKNPHYWDAAHVVLNTIHYVSSNDTNSMLQQYKNNQIDWIHEIPEGQLPHLEKSMPQDVRRSPYLSNQYYVLQHKHPLLGKKELREALSLAIDRNIIVKNLDAVIPSYSFSPKGVAGIPSVVYPWSPEGEKPLTMDQRLKKARDLLKAAGVGSGTKLDLLYNTNERHKKVALMVASQWKQLGIKVTLTNKDYKTVIADRARGQFELSRSGWIADYDWYYTYASLFLCTEKSTLTHYCNPKFDETLLKAVHEVDPQKSQDLGVQALKIAMDDYVIIPLYQDEQVRLVKPFVGGYAGSVLNRHPAKDLFIIQH